MLYDYLKIDKDKIKRAMPQGYIAKVNIEEWELVEYQISSSDSYYNSKIIIENNEGNIIEVHDLALFFNEKGLDAIKQNERFKGVANIETVWDKSFPESIRLKYSAYDDDGFLKPFNHEKNYFFKVWPYNNSTIKGFKTISEKTKISNSNGGYFKDIIEFIEKNNTDNYDEWIDIPMFSLKKMMNNNFIRDGKIYRLYKINDVNAQSLSTSFDEYIPFCFDGDGRKIEQYKIAMITSYNKSEIYLLYEVHEDNDIKISNNKIVIKDIENVIFWRAGYDENIIRNKDERILITDNGPNYNNRLSNISNYFINPNVETNIARSYQNTDNDNTGSYNITGEIDEGFAFVGLKDPNKPWYVDKYIYGRYNENIDIVLNKNTSFNFNNRYINKITIFSDGKYISPENYNITTDSSGIIDIIKFNKDVVENNVVKNNDYIEIFISKNNKKVYKFTLIDTKPYGEINSSNVQSTIYNMGFPWKTLSEIDIIAFNSEGAYISDDNDEVKYIIVNGIFNTYNNDEHISELEALDVGYDDSVTYDILDIVYDPYLDSDIGDNYHEFLDMWIFDNTYNDIKIRENEPYLIKKDNKIKIFGETDPLSEFIDDEDNEYLLNNNDPIEIVSEDSVDDIKNNQEEISTISKNILKMLFYSDDNKYPDDEEYQGWQNSWSTTNELKVSGEYAIIKAINITSPEEFPSIIINHGYSYQNQESVKIWVKPEEINGEYYYVLHRDAEECDDLRTYSFSENIKYLMI